MVHLADRQPFGKVVAYSAGGGWGSETPDDEDDVAVSVIRGADFPQASVGSLSGAPFRYEKLAKVEKCQLEEGDIILEISGGTAERPTGRTVFVTKALLKEAVSPVIPASFCRLVRIDRVVADPRYCYYWLQEMHSSGRAFVYQNRSTGISNFQFRHFLEAERLRLPPIEEQRGIGELLGALDDKIEVNRRISETLEQIAWALFKSWFVDFDPVRAKMEGRDSDLLADIADLFPSRLVVSETGEIPEGWEEGPLGDFFDIGRGGVWGEEEPSNTSAIAGWVLRGIDCHNMAEGIRPDVPRRWLGEKQLSDRQLVEGCILIEGSGSFCGRSLIWHPDYESVIGQPVCYSNFCKRLDPRRASSQSWVCWYQMRHGYSRGELQAFRTGTAFPNLDARGLLANFHVVVPPENVSKLFEKVARSARGIARMAESETLAALRDTLLQKLISGEVHVSAA